MAEFVKVINEKNRMCKTYQTCLKCPIRKQETCTDFIKKHPQEAEEIIMKWAKEHPIKTNAEKFKEVFGFEPDKSYCSYLFDTMCESYANGCAECPNSGFWYKEYKENKQ